MSEKKNETATITGRSGERARMLLDIAEELGLSKTVVKATTGGYEVPSEVADAYEEKISPKPKAAPKKTTTTKKAETSADDQGKE